MIQDGSGQAPSPEDQSAASAKTTVQTTLSTIGDLGVAGSGMFARGGDKRPSSRVPAAIIFFLFVYVVTVTVVSVTSRSSPLVHSILMPLIPTGFALAAYLSSRTWKSRALEFKSRLKIFQEALQSLGHEAANAANATQANLAGFRNAHPELKCNEHLDEIAAAARKIGVAVQQANDPMKKKAES